MKFVTCLSWICKGAAASSPQKLQLPPEELKQLVEETKESCGQDVENEDCEGPEKEEDTNQTNAQNSTAINDDEDGDINARYNLDGYDDDDKDNPVFTISDLAVHVDNHDDEYITDHESEDDLEEKEDFTIKNSDNLLVVGGTEGDSAILEIYVYNELEDSFYVHHDIVLPAYPLALEWLQSLSGNEPGNIIAVGDMSPEIKIWDLDIVDALEPDYVLGKRSKKIKAKKMKTEEDYFHSDAVMSLSWRKDKKILASGSADSTIILWDFDKGQSIKKLSYHSNEVQALQWHPKESSLLLSGCMNGYLKVYDDQSFEVSGSWKVDGEIERVLWDLNSSYGFFCSTDKGWIYSIDRRHSEIQHSFHAHESAVTGLDVSPQKPDLLVSASTEVLKLWNLKNDLQIAKLYKLKVGSVHALKVASDLSLTVAVGGDSPCNNIKLINVYKDMDDPSEESQKNTIKFVQKEETESETSQTLQKNRSNSSQIKEELQSDSADEANYPEMNGKKKRKRKR